ncbi:hypothetical protein BJV82DRAFT_670641 [Fennellomyces sp. T-0311]|nr:hypothetical protein BJV82DRAFT_670641 [Fennellomyces sp. T-0311]
MTPSNATLTSSTSTIMKHTAAAEPEGAKKSRFSPSYYDVYGGNAPATGQMMMSSAYSPGTYHHQGSASTFSQYPPGTNSTYNYGAGNGAPTAVMNGPPTPQFVQNTSLGPPSPAALASPFSTPPFTNASAAGYASHMPSPQLSSASHQTARTVYVGNIPADTSVSDILDHVKAGNVDSVRPLPEKNCTFITFVDAAAAAQFYHEATTTKKLTINGSELRIGWGRPSSIPTQIHVALQNGASRNVFLGSLDGSVTEQYLHEQLARFGEIEHIKLIKDKDIAFVHFLSTSSAIKCVTTLPTETQWASRRVNYGRDRCAPSKSSSSPSSSSSSSYMPIFPSSTSYPLQVRFPSVSYDPYTGAPVETYPASPVAATGTASLMGIANRTIYLGNIHPDTTCEEICNVVRGGILSQIRYLSDKHIAFVTFVDPSLALHFYNQALYHGLVIKNRRLKVGWGKGSALSPQVVSAVQNGGSRNVYLGNIDDTITEEKLKQDFADYGEIELVNTLKEKNCAFVNFTSIAAAVRAIEGIRSKEEYKKFRINYGKDRCGNPPRMHNRQPRVLDPAMLTPSSAAATDTDEQPNASSSQEVPAEAVNGVLDAVLVPNG